MRYELNDYEWSIIRRMLPNKPRGVPGWTTGALSTASFGSCAQAHHGEICHTAIVPQRPHPGSIQTEQMPSRSLSGRATEMVAPSAMAAYALRLLI